MRGGALAVRPEQTLSNGGSWNGETASQRSQRVDHVVVQSGGQILGHDGKPIVGSLDANPQAHIPLSDWVKWTSWNTP